MTHQIPSSEPESSANKEASEDRLPSTRSHSLSESKIEEIITALWAIVWATLWGAGAPTWVLWIFGINAATDYLCVIWFAIREIREENVPVLAHADENLADQ